nr:probable receptor-like protein kinase At5g59700 [Ipomoea trifida]
MCVGAVDLVFLIWSILCLICVSKEYVPVDNYLVNCGSSENVTVSGRVFLADTLNSGILSTPHRIFAKTSSNLHVPFPFNYDSPLYQTARILNGTSEFSFPIRKPGRHWVRLHFFPFMDQNYNLSSARFSVSAQDSQNFTLLKNFQPSNASVLKEYSFNISTNRLVLVFTPAANSFGFVNALEVFSLPDEVIPSGAGMNNPQGIRQDLSGHALETIARINMGIAAVPPQNDTLWRVWVPDARYLSSSNLVHFVSKKGDVNYTGSGVTQNIAPPLVYETAERLEQVDFSIRFNATWSFAVDPGFEYFVRFHFCDIVSNSSSRLMFNVFLNSGIVSANLELRTKNVPYYIDVVKRLGNDRDLSITIGPSDVGNVLPDGILNGLEIMKISNSKDSLDAADSEIQSSSTSSKAKLWAILGSSIGAFCLLVFGLVSVLVYRSRRRGSIDRSTGGDEVSKYAEETSSISRSKPVIDPSRPRENVNLIEWVMNTLKKGDLETAVDPHIKAGLNPESLQKFAETAEKCLAGCGLDRPTMGDVLWNLEFALQLQRKDETTTSQNHHDCANVSQPDEISTSTTQFSIGSMGDLAGVSISRVFSQMVKADMKDLNDKI